MFVKLAAYEELPDDSFGALKEAAFPGLGTLLHMGVGGALGHGATNVAGRAAHHGSNIADVLAHKGLQHGFLEKEMNPIASFLTKSMAGPESLVGYNQALKAGKHLASLPPAEQKAYIDSLLAVTPKSEAPLIEPLRRALQHHVDDTAPVLQTEGALAKLYGKGLDAATNMSSHTFDSTGKKVMQGTVPAVAAGALASVEPGLLGHGIFNQAREAVGKSPIGKMFMKDQFMRGLQGKTLSPRVEMAMDIGLSPGALDTYRMGKELRNIAPEGLQGALSQVTYDDMKALKGLSDMAERHGFSAGGGSEVLTSKLDEAMRSGLVRDMAQASTPGEAAGIIAKREANRRLENAVNKFDGLGRFGGDVAAMAGIAGTMGGIAADEMAQESAKMLSNWRTRAVNKIRGTQPSAATGALPTPAPTPASAQSAATSNTQMRNGIMAGAGALGLGTLGASMVGRAPTQNTPQTNSTEGLPTPTPIRSMFRRPTQSLYSTTTPQSLGYA